MTSVQVIGLATSAAQISAGRLHTCAVTSTGGAKCWGSNSSGQIGDGTTTTRSAPVNVSGLTTGVVAIAGGALHSCALTGSGGVKCWGDNLYGQLGDGTTTNRSTPVNVTGLTAGVSAIAVGPYHSCALTSAGAVKCWGWNYLGALGDGTGDSSSTPVNAFGLSTGVAAISAGGDSYDFTCAVTTSAGAKCWGYNDYGQLGDGTTTDQPLPTSVVGLSNGVAVTTNGGRHSCALTSGGGVKCWGDNEGGKVGDGSTTDRLTPVDVVGMASGITAIDAGQSHSCALTAIGGVKCWGDNYAGQLGNGESGVFVTPRDAVGFGIACADGVLDAGEDCDDGNTSDGDCCSPTCQFESASVVCRAAAAECDVAETCTGSSGSCPSDAFQAPSTPCGDDGDACTLDSCDGEGSCQHDLLPDSDGDSVCDAEDVCTNVAGLRDFITKPKAKLVFSKVDLDPTPGNEQLVLAGSFNLPSDVAFGDLDPQQQGARVVVRNALGGVILDASLPSGIYEGNGTRGWKSNGKQTLWQYIDKSASPNSGIVGFKVTDRGKGQLGGLVAVSITGKKGSYSVAAGDEPLNAAVVLGNQASASQGMCGEVGYGTGDCSFNRASTTLKCLR